MITLLHRPSFAVIGKEGSFKEGKGFVGKLIGRASESFSEVSMLGSKDEEGAYLGFWGLMSDFSRSFKPWGNHFSEGLYLYGVECPLEAKAPSGWTKWIAPENDYLVNEVTPETYEKIFGGTVYYEIPFEGYKLCGACFDFTDPKTQKSYIYFPVKPNPIRAKKEDLTAKIAPCGCHCAYCFFDECEGCGSKNDFCSFAAFQKDHKCPNVECSKDKGFKGCYECPELPACHIGLFASEGGNARPSALFIQRHGKKAYEEAIKRLLGKEKPFYQLMCNAGGDEKQIEVLEEALGK